MDFGHMTVHNVDIIPVSRAFRADPVNPPVLAVKHPLTPETFDASGIVRPPGFMVLDLVDNGPRLEIMGIFHEPPPDSGDVIR